MFRSIRLMALVGIALVVTASPALACGGLVSANGTVQLGRTTTLAAYHDGIEHYLTAFEFEGSGAEFGSIVPLPDAPTKVIEAGRWTLQRLELEVNPPVLEFAATGADLAAPAANRAEVILRAKVEALDVTVLKGGGDAVGLWARQHGFELTPDAPEVLDFYAERSPIFMAVQFNAKRAAALGQGLGQSTAVHVVIPTDRPWVPLRILALGAGAAAPINADVFLLNDREPALLPDGNGLFARTGLKLERSEPASKTLLTDLSSDRGMAWLPDSGMWLTFLRLDAKAGNLDYDLAIDPSGLANPSPVDAGLVAPSSTQPVSSGSSMWVVWLALAAVGILAVAAAAERSRVRTAR